MVLENDEAVRWVEEHDRPIFHLHMCTYAKTLKNRQQQQGTVISRLMGCQQVLYFIPGTLQI